MNRPQKISLLYCSNSFSNETISYCINQIEGIEFSTFSLPCSGKADLLYILKALETGSDAVLIMTCKLGECKFIQGNLRAQKRVDAVNTLMEEIGTDIKHVKFVQIPENNKVKNILDEINKSIEDIGTESESAYELTK